MPDAKFTITARDRTKAAFASVHAGLSRMTRALGPLRLGIAGVVGTAGMGALIQHSLKSADALGKTADKLGLTTEGLAGLRHAGELTGVSVNTLDMAVQRMTRRIAEAAQGTGEAKAAIRELGLDAAALKAMGPERAFQVLAGAMGEVENQGDRVRLAMRLFDSEGVALVNTLGLGEEGLRDVAAEAEALGITLDRVQVARIEQANDAMTRIRAAISGVANRITVQLAPVISGIADRFTAASVAHNGFRDEVISGTRLVVKAVGYLGDGIRGLDLLWETGKLAFLSFKAAVLDGLVILAEKFNAVAEAIPFLDPAPLDGIARSATEAGIAAGMAQAELIRLATEPLPSAKIDAFFDDLQQRAETAAQAVADARTGRIAAGGATSEPTADPALQRQLDRLALALGTEEERIRESYQRRQQIIQEALNNRLIDQLKFIELSKANDDQRVEELQKNALKWADAWDDAFNRFSAGVGDAVADAIFEQKSFGDAMKAVARDVLKQVISGLVEIGVKKLILAGIEKTILAGTTAANVAAGASTAVAWAPAAAAVSLATLGGNSVPAMAGMASTFALSESLAAASLAGVAHDGLDHVPRDGTYLLQEGEGVLRRQDNQGLRDFLGNARGGDVNITFQVQALDASDAVAVIRRNRGTIIGIVQDAYERRAAAGGPLG